MRLHKGYWLLPILILSCVLFLTASIPDVSSGTWQTWNNLGDVRSGAAAVLLQDGRVLIIGGTNANGPVASADLFGTDGVFSAATAMQTPRSRHTATVLSDGRVLITGGTTSSGGAVNTAEIYDPNANSWSAPAVMVDARAEHTASLLSDGRVLLAGGHDSSGNGLSSLEIFDPTSGKFSNAGALSVPRMNHAAATLGDGRVLIIGGTADGTTALASSDIYDPSAGTVSAGPVLSTPRMSATATTTLDGKVAVIGGNNGSANGSQDLVSAEIFDPATGQLSTSASNLVAARSGHQAFLLPKNNAILVLGGSSSGTDLNSAELYYSWADSFQSTGAMSVARPGVAGSAIGVDGRLLAVGGTSLASTELYGFATVKTDAADYPPGSIVTITGSGWQPGETVTLTLLETPLIDTHPAMTAIADAFGNILNNQFSPDVHDVNVRFYLTAVGIQSGWQAQNTFTDAPGDNTDTTVSCSPNPVTVNTATTCTATVVNSQTGAPNGSPQGFVTWQFNGTGTFSSASCALVAGGGPSTSQCQVTLTPTAVANGNVKGNYNSSDNGKWKNSPSPNFALTVTAPSCTAPAVSTQPGNQTITYGADATFSATASGNPAPTVQWQVNTGSGFTDISGATSTTLTVTRPAVIATGNQYRAVFTNSCTPSSATSNAATLTVNKATAVVVVTPYTSPGTTYTGLPHTAAVTSITGVNGETGATVGAVNVSNTTHTAAGTYSTDSWSFTGTANYNDIASTTITDSIAKATAVVVVTPYTSPGTTYTGLPHTAAVTSITGVNGETGATVGAVNVSNTTHTAAGTYSTDSWSFTGTANYNDIASTTITDSIAKATAVVVVTPYTSPGTTYTGLPHTAAVTSITGVNGETGATVGAVNVSNTTHTAAGTYSTDSWSFTGTANYNDIANTTITDSIAKATAVVVVTPYTSPGTTYTGLPHTAAVTSITGVNGETGATVGAVDVSNTTHTAAGTYSTDSWSFTGTANYNDIANTTITDSIAKATAVVVVTPYTSPGTTYTGLPHTAAVTSITGVNGETGATVGAVNVSNTTHTAAGTYSTDSWSFTGTANYNDIASTTITDSIAKATAVVVVTPYTSPGTTYTGLPHTAAVTSITGVNGETGATVGAVNVSNTTHTAAGTYSTDSWSFTGTANYNDIANTTITDSIAKATAVVVVTPYTSPGTTYTGLPHTAAVTSITGVNGETGATVGAVNVSNTTHTAAGTYSTDSWSFTGTANYNDIASTTITDSIAKATAVVVVTPYTSPGTTYTGLPHTAAVTSITGVNGETGATVGAVDVSNTTHTAAGTYSTDSWSFTGTANYNDIANTTITDSIAKATAVVVVTPYTSPGTTYTGLPHTAAVTSITGVNGETGATVGAVNVSNTTHTAAGTYSTDSWSFTGTANYNDIANTTITDSIAKATAVVVVTPYTSPGTTYTGLPHTAAVTSITGVNGETGATVGAVDVSNTTHTAAGTYSTDSWSFTGTANYNDIASTTITDSIAKATAVVVVTPYTSPGTTYTGLPHTAAVTSITGVNGETGATVGAVNVSNTTHTAAGTYSTDSWSFTGTANYNDIASTTITDSIAKATAVVVVTPYTSPGTTYTGLPHTAAVTSITGVNGETGATVGAVDVSNTTHTAAGTYSTDSWSFTGTANYNDIANTTITDSIAKATAVVVVTPYTVTYDGNLHTATVTSITGVNGETGATVGTVNVSNTTHTNPGDYPSDAWSFSGGTNYNNANGTVHDSIGYGACSVGVGGVILPPINLDGTSVYSRKGGSTIPVKFNVCGANGAPLTDPTLVFAPTGGALIMTGALRGTISVVNEVGTTDIPDAAFTWDGQQWHFNMATMNLNSGYTYTFRINLAYAPASIQFAVGVK